MQRSIRRGIETQNAARHLLVMAHITFDHRGHRNGTSHLGEVGFYSLLGIVAIVLAGLFGIYWLSQDALQGVVSLATGI
jgi:hypothetical protein